MARPTPGARLRKTFHYPSDDDDVSSPSTPEVLDEQEQETLIATLTTQNNTRNTSFLRTLSLLPLLSTIPFLLGLFLTPQRSGNNTTRSPSHVLCLLGLSSLFATGWMLFRLAVTETGFAVLDEPARNNTASGSGSGSDPARGGYGYGLARTGSWGGTATGGGGLGNPGLGRILNRRGRRGDGLLGGPSVAGKSPLEKHLPLLNVGLALLALLTGLLERVKLGPVSTGVSPLLLGALPGVVYAVVVGSKVVMAGVDPEKELRGLKYGYKGA